MVPVAEMSLAIGGDYEDNERIAGYIKETTSS
jgi:hypothetical protein